MILKLNINFIRRDIMGILSVIGLCSLIFILLYICFRIFISIINTFVYLTGLTVILLFVVFILLLILYFINRLIRRYTCYKRSKLSSREIIHLISKFQLRVICELCALSIFLYTIKLLINIL